MNGIKKFWNYLRHATWMKAEESMDPMVLLDMSYKKLEDKDREIREGGIKAIGWRKQIEQELATAISQASKLKEDVIAALHLADKAETDEDRYRYEQAASDLALELEAAENRVAMLKSNLSQAREQAEYAKRMVKQNASQLKEVAVQRIQIAGKIQASKLSRDMADNLQLMRGSMDDDVPSFQQIEERVNKDMALSEARTEMFTESGEGAQQIVQAEVIRQRSAARLDAIRAEIKGELGTGSEDMKQIDAPIDAEEVETVEA